MRLHVYVTGKYVAHLYRQADDYALRYTADALDADFASLIMPVRDDAWIWPRDLHPFFRQNLPEGFLLQVIREEFGPYLDGTDLSLLAIIGGSGIGRVTVTPESGTPDGKLDPLDLKSLLHEDMTTARFADLVRYYARAAISGAVPKFLAPESPSTGKDIVEAAKNETRWHWIAKQMLHAWNEGMGSLRSAKPQVVLKALTPVIEAAGFSDADQADNAKAIIGRSELLANHDKKH
ncbi:HipA N-terminal domain-containing protein [Burkholderia cenocepacia]|uniref:HipA N-terminal domain-containing protein n=2 Tax=Burkholderia cenocepacia TaxID=95486 RepID=UPI002854C9B7|nr:HipA N-terminal domain-containing protein [Burkholderia cenocepacia]MDR8031861.1 HipA N-terminal domain-containing protein [Burkholderia cenocepacia]MDR8039997.1 HipA N-terminal domain-containing protein [Burkholderia cenocepacia]